MATESLNSSVIFTSTDSLLALEEFWRWMEKLERNYGGIGQLMKSLL